MNRNWSNIEVELIVSDYFSMLIDELQGIPVNKAAHRKQLSPLLNNRSQGSVEFKHQNISAVLAKSGLPFIVGYKPRYNYQKSLELAVFDYIEANLNLKNNFANFVDIVPDPIPVGNIEFRNWIVPAPSREVVVAEPPGFGYRKPVKINYLEKEQRNRKLGLLGEEIAIAYERWFLINAGKEALADKIEWVSKEQGDGLGFDILSKNLNGTDKYIEVKTTKLSKETPIFFTKTEYEFSIEKSDNFNLYRIFNFDKTPAMFWVKGEYDQFCQMEPVQYKGYF